MIKPSPRVLSRLLPWLLGSVPCERQGHVTESLLKYPVKPLALGDGKGVFPVANLAYNGQNKHIWGVAFQLVYPSKDLPLNAVYCYLSAWSDLWACLLAGTRSWPLGLSSCCWKWILLRSDQCFHHWALFLRSGRFWSLPPSGPETKMASKKYWTFHYVLCIYFLFTKC